MRHKFTHLMAVVLLSGCASGGQGSPSSDDASSDGLEIVAENEGARTVTLFAQWEFGRSIRLGDLRGGQTRTFTTPMRGGRVLVTFGAVGARRASSSGGAGFVPALVGDRLQWTLTVSGRAEIRRLPPR